MDPFDEFDPHHRITGKKAFNDNVRCLQSKIDLKITQDELPKKEKFKNTIQQSFIEEFERKYKEGCDNKFQNKKQRGVSSDNPFDENNKPPLEHLIPDYILEKPCKIQNLQSFKDSKPLAGKFSEIGQQIFNLGGKKAAHIVTGNWDKLFEEKVHDKRSISPIPIEPHKK